MERINNILKNDKVKFVMKYLWLFFGWVFLTIILTRSGLGFFAILTALFWALNINSSEKSDGGEFVPELISRLPVWILQHVISLFVILTLLRTNWTGFSVFALFVCIMAPMLALSQFSRWFNARQDKFAAIARADAMAASQVGELELLEARIRAEYEVPD